MRIFTIILSLTALCFGASASVPAELARKKLPRKFNPMPVAAEQRAMQGKHSVKVAEASIEDFYGEFRMEYGSYVSQCYFMSNVTIEPSGADGAVTIAGFYDDDVPPLEATVDAAAGTITIPQQTFEWYGDTYLLTSCDYDRDTEEATPTPERPLVGVMAEDGLIEFADAWMLIDTYDDSTWDICDFARLYITNGSISFGLDGDDWEDGIFSRFDGNELTVYNFGYLGTIVFAVDAEASEVRSEPELIFLSNYDGDWYFATIVAYDENDPDAEFIYEKGITGTITVTGDNNSEIEFPDWSGICPVEDDDPWWSGLYTGTRLTVPFDLKAASGIGAAAAASAVASAPEYYNLQGCRVEAPGAGLYIVKTGDKVEKRILR